MAENDFNRGTYPYYNDPLDSPSLEEYFWTLGETDPDEVNSFIDMEEEEVIEEENEE